MTSLNIGDWLGFISDASEPGTIYWYEVCEINQSYCKEHKGPGVLIYVGGRPIWHPLNSMMESKAVIKATSKEKLAYNLKTNLRVYDVT